METAPPCDRGQRQDFRRGGQQFPDPAENVDRDRRSARAGRGGGARRGPPLPRAGTSPGSGRTSRAQEEPRHSGSRPPGGGAGSSGWFAITSAPSWLRASPRLCQGQTGGFMARRVAPHIPHSPEAAGSLTTFPQTPPPAPPGPAWAPHSAPQLLPDSRFQFLGFSQPPSEVRPPSPLQPSSQVLASHAAGSFRSPPDLPGGLLSPDPSALPAFISLTLTFPPEALFGVRPWPSTPGSQLPSQNSGSPPSLPPAPPFLPGHPRAGGGAAQPSSPT